MWVTIKLQLREDRSRSWSVLVAMASPRTHVAFVTIPFLRHSHRVPMTWRELHAFPHFLEAVRESDGVLEVWARMHENFPKGFIAVSEVH